MAGSDFESRDDAAEYVLGTLDAAERAAFEARMAADPGLAADVVAWERRLTVLSEETPDVEPPADAFEKILTRIEPADDGNVVQLKRRVAMWRGASVGFAALAAALILFLLLPAQLKPQQKGLYVAVLQGSDASPAFVAAVDVRSKLIVVRRVGAPTPAGHSYELWALGGGRAAPQPLGVIDASMRIPAGQLGGKPLDTTTFAVSLEPAGGSPTGLPTGPVLFTGKLLSTE